MAAVKGMVSIDFVGNCTLGANSNLATQLKSIRFKSEYSLRHSNFLISHTTLTADPRDVTKLCQIIEKFGYKRYTLKFVGKVSPKDDPKITNALRRMGVYDINAIKFHPPGKLRNMTLIDVPTVHLGKVCEVLINQGFKQ